MRIDWLDYAWAQMELLKDTLEVFPDIDNESQRECMVDAVKTLRELAAVIEKAAKCPKS